MRLAVRQPDDAGGPPVLAAIERNVERFVTLAGGTSEQQWTRTATRLPDERRTVLWMVRQAAHEGLHHLHDIGSDFPGGPRPSGNRTGPE